MKLLQELLENLKGSVRKAMDLGRSTGEAGKPMAKQETIEQNMGPDTWVPYSEGYKEGKRTFDTKNKGRRDGDKTVTEAADDKADKMWAAWQTRLKREQKSLSKNAGKETEHSIGDNLNTGVSGDVGFRKDFTSSGTTWGYALTVGNNLNGKDALKEVKRIFADLKSDADKFADKTTLAGTNKNWLIATVGEMKLHVQYKYASSFCWVGIRIANK